MADGSFTKRISAAWNVFSGKEEKPFADYGMPMYGIRSYSSGGITLSGRETILDTIYNQLAVDVSALTICHARVDQDGVYTEQINSKLNNCLTVGANKDQAPRAFKQDVVISLLKEGCIAIVPVDTYGQDPAISDNYDIASLRVGSIVGWYPDHIRVRLYNDRTGKKEEIVIEKRLAAIIENPFYMVMNEPNSTVKRLTGKLALLDKTDNDIASGKLDVIIQLPYIIKTEARQKQAEERRKSIEMQLQGSKYGIAYTDGTERITQLNRPAENNLLEKVKQLTLDLYTQLRLTPEIINGSATEEAMLNYHVRTVKPLADAIVEEMRRKFLTKTGITQGQTILYIRNPFEAVPVEAMAQVADTLTRNEVVSSNEIRPWFGLKPRPEPRADALQNKNLNPSEFTDTTSYGVNQNGGF